MFISLLQSPQLQLAWFNHLTVSRGPKEAAIFKDLIFNMQQSPEFVASVKQLILTKKMLAAGHGKIDATILMQQPPPPFMLCPPPPSQPMMPPPMNEKPPILAQDLEAMLLRESRHPASQSMMTSRFLGVESLLEDSTTPLNEVLKNDPVLSEILHQGDDSSPDSGCWGSVSSILNPKSSFDAETKPPRFAGFGPATKTAELAAAGSSCGNVPLYLRRSGMANPSDDVTDNRKSDDDFMRFGQDPLAIGPPVSPPTPIPMFQRQASVDPFTGLKRETPNPLDPFAGSTSFNGSSSTTLSSASQPPASSDSGKPGSGSKSQLTYANVCRNPQLLRETNDPLTRIRNLGTQGNRDFDLDGAGSNQTPKLFSYFGGDHW